jgi:stage II sporulation protein AA (anti-sigma F factor antagonist)
MTKENAFCRTQYKNGILKASIKGEIDHHSAVKTRERIDEDILCHRPKEIILDLSSVSFMDSSGLGLILGRAALGQEIGANVRVRNASERIKKILSMAGVCRIENLIIEKSKEK